MYVARIVDARISALLREFAVVVVEGAPGVGKSATARQAAASGAGLVLVDDWHRTPTRWGEARRVAGDRVPPGRFLLAGRPLPDGPHPGVVSVRMRPRSLAERGVDRPTVSVGALLSGTRPPIDGGTDVTLTRYAAEIVASGFPGVRPTPTRTRGAQLDGYLRRLVRDDLPAAGRGVRRRATFGRWLTAYAAATATTSSQNAVLRDASTGPAAPPAKTTSLAYRTALTGLGLLDPVPAWLPEQPGLGKVGHAPKHHLVDPSLAARLLGVDAAGLLSGPADRLEALFESLVTQSVRTYADTAGARTCHYRTRDARHAADLILDSGAGGVVALQVTVSTEPPPDALADLRWLRGRLGDGLLDAVVVTTGSRAYRRPDGTAVVPAALLGP